MKKMGLLGTFVASALLAFGCSESHDRSQTPTQTTPSQSYAPTTPSSEMQPVRGTDNTDTTPTAPPQPSTPSAGDMSPTGGQTTIPPGAQGATGTQMSPQATPDPMESATPHDAGVMKRDGGMAPKH